VRLPEGKERVRPDESKPGGSLPSRGHPFGLLRVPERVRPVRVEVLKIAERHATEGAEDGRIGFAEASHRWKGARVRWEGRG
jgi:hypothetical protein